MRSVRPLACLLVLTLLAGPGCGAPMQTSYVGQSQSVDSAPDKQEGEARRIILEADVTLAVESVEKLEKQLPEQLAAFSGFVSRAVVDRTDGRRPSATWVVRIPTARCTEFLAVIAGLGAVEKMQQTTQEVTAEFVDLEARIANAKRLEQRILELLAKSRDELKEVIVVEQELARVRGEIERAEGQRRFLENRTSLATVTIHAEQRERYVPPQAPTFFHRVAATWQMSLDALRELVEAILLLIVSLTPWLLSALPVAVVVYFTARLIWKRSLAVGINHRGTEGTELGRGGR